MCALFIGRILVVTASLTLLPYQAYVLPNAVSLNKNGDIDEDNNVEVVAIPGGGGGGGGAVVVGDVVLLPDVVGSSALPPAAPPASAAMECRWQQWTVWWMRRQRGGGGLPFVFGHSWFCVEKLWEATVSFSPT